MILEDVWRYFACQEKDCKYAFNEQSLEEFQKPDVPRFTDAMREHTSETGHAKYAIGVGCDVIYQGE